MTLAFFISARRRFCTPPVSPSITSARRMNVTPRVDESDAADFYNVEFGHMHERTVYHCIDVV